jgi:hypothetical protein
MDQDATAETLRRLLLMHEGVTIDHLHTHPSGCAMATLRIADPASIARFACWAQNSDVGVHVWGDLAEANPLLAGWGFGLRGAEKQMVVIRRFLKIRKLLF